MLEALLVGGMVMGCLAFGAWAVSVWMRTELAQPADWTSWAIFQTGRALVWVAIVVLAGGLLGGVAAAMVRLLGGHG